MKPAHLFLALTTLFLGCQLAQADCEAYDFETLTITSSTAVGLTAAKYATASGADFEKAALVSLETASVRFRLDGTSPTPTVGHLVVFGDSFKVTSRADMGRLKLIGATATGTAQVTYFRGACQ